MKTSGNKILDLTFAFALEIIAFSEQLEAKKQFIIANQLMRSGTSIGANTHEAQNAESKADFIHKLKIAAKEAAETEYWLNLCTYAQSYESPDLLMDQLNHIQRTLSKIISSTKNNSN